jgi:branched-chain amino acid transport system substrate-binding protein
MSAFEVTGIEITGIGRRSVLKRATLAALGAAIGGGAARAADPEPIPLGVSGPLTGQNAQYGAQWKTGFDLALDAVNGQGGINGRPLRYVFEDSQSDPRQAVAIAQKFVGDKRIVMELGDFSSPASMAASPIYQRAGLVQFGFTNSHPDFTKGGDYMWSTSISQSDQQPLLAEYAIKLGLKRLAVVHLNTDWGRTSKELFVKAAQEHGVAVVAAEGYMPDEKDHRSMLVRVRDANPDGVILISYYADAALIARQVRTTGLKQPMVAVSSVYSPKLLELGGDAVNGLYTQSNFFPGLKRPDVQQFVHGFQAKYGQEPDAFAAYAYDAMMVAAAAIKQGGPDRKAIHDAMATIRDVPSLIYGKTSFDPTTRRVHNPQNVDLLIKDGQFTEWDGAKAIASN